MYPKTSRLKRDVLKNDLVEGGVIDIGCGHGLYAADYSWSAPVLQVDIVDRRNEAMREYPFISGDCETLSIEKNRYANAIMFDLLEHLDDDISALKKLKEANCKKCFFSVPNAEDEQVAQLMLTHRHHLDKTHRREYTKKGLYDLFDVSGWQITKVYPNYNTCIFDFAFALSNESNMSRAAAQFITWQLRLFRRLRLFENRCIADWVGVAENVASC